MKKVIIVGGGIAGMTAGIYLQKAGFETEIFEKNAVVGGQCMGWKRKGFTIDNCIHWLTGSAPGSSLNELWREVGALGDHVELRKKESFFRTQENGKTLTFWRDAERTRKEMLDLSPEDEKEINLLIDHVKLAESMTVPVDKPFDMMSPFEFMKMGMSMAGMGKVMKQYGGIDVDELANRFQSPLIRKAILDYMPPGYQAYAFLVSYATVTAGNGDIPAGGSLAMALRMAKRYEELAGKIHTNAPAERILIQGKKASGIRLEDGCEIPADYVVCACDTDFTFGKLLDKSYMPKALRKLYEEPEKYPLSSGFQIALGVDGIYEELHGTNFFECEPLQIFGHRSSRMSVSGYDYEPEFAPEGKMVIQSNFVQTIEDYEEWEKLYRDKEAYEAAKASYAEEVVKRLKKQFPFLEGKAELLDVWTPVTYHRYCNAYKGAYMSFIVRKNAKNARIPGKIKDLSNVMIASQWLMPPGGLPTAAAMGKFAAMRIMKKEKMG